ncbi:MAG: hypothetical protein JXA30_19015, partial [Deltaproteobacteria bacterium]|nr:hypothetical protein [Deltaproteobacteria bacterium]
EPARGRKPVLRDEMAAVVVKQQYPPERLLIRRRCNEAVLTAKLKGMDRKSRLSLFPLLTL